MKITKTEAKIVSVFLRAATVIILVYPTVIIAQRPGEIIEIGPEKVGTAGAQFLEIGISARAMGMGEAFVAVSDDASSVYYNPAGIAHINEMQILVSHSKWFADIDHYFGALILPMENIGTIGLNFIVLATDDIPVRIPFIGETGENFRASEAALGLSYAKSLTDRFSLGGTVKWINEDYYNHNANVIAADIGTLFKTGFRNMKIGMSVTNFGPDLHFSESSTGFIGQNYPLPIHFKFGIATNIYKNEQHDVTVALDINQPNDNLRRENIGLEYIWNDLLSLRGGYKADYDSEDFSFGAGIDGAVGGYNGTIDASWSNMKHLGTSTRLTFGFTF